MRNFAQKLRDLAQLPVVTALVVTAASCGPAAVAQDRENCLFCHKFPGLGRVDSETGRLRLFYVEPSYVQHGLGPHARLACTDCHLRDEVSVVPHRAVTPVSCARECHLSSPNSPLRLFSHENIAGMLTQSVHPPEMLGKLSFSAGPLLAEGQSQCLYCHDEPVFRDPFGLSPALRNLEGRVFDRCDVCHTTEVPADVDYHLRHVVARLAPARATLEMAQVCAVCHSDRKVLAEHGMHDAVASFGFSFHGKAALLGETRTADCLACHVKTGANVHLMLGPSNPQSAVHPDHVADSCRSLACHPGADPGLASAGVHVDFTAARDTVEFALAAAFVTLTLAAFGPWLVLAVMELLHTVLGRHSPEEQRTAKLAQTLLQHPEGRRRLQRYTRLQRVQHWYLAFTFTLLALTGLPQKFSDHAWARRVVQLFGNLDVTRTVHHLAGIALMAGLVGHLVYVGWTLKRAMRTPGADGRPPGFVRALTSLPMWLGLDDLRKAREMVAHLFFRRPEPPAFERFSLKEKFGYMAVFWGSVMLGVTGVIMWGEQIASHIVGGRAVTLSSIAHSDEAFLAVTYIGILHLADVLLSPHAFPMSRATVTGLTPVGVLAKWHRGQVERVARELGVLPAAEAVHA
jgi:cytochrome b subunit of formate dehydrogenase